MPSGDGKWAESGQLWVYVPWGRGVMNGGPWKAEIEATVCVESSVEHSRWGRHEKGHDNDSAM